MIDLSTATSSNSTWNRDEKDYLPVSVKINLYLLYLTHVFF